MEGVVFPPCYLTWGQTIVVVMKIMVTSFKRSHAHTAILSAPNPATGHCQPTPLPETPGHSWASLGQSLMGSLLLFPGSWCTQGFVCVQDTNSLQETVSPVLCKFWWLYGGLMATSSKGAYAKPRSTALRAPAPAAVHCWHVSPQETLKHNSVSVSVWFLGPGVHRYIWALCASLAGMVFSQVNWIGSWRRQWGKILMGFVWE